MKRKILKLLLPTAIVYGILVYNGIDAEAGFDATYYANRYPDVVAGVGNDYNALYNHYLTFGIKEGRFGSLEDESTNNKFDASYYASKYPDVVKVFGNNYDALYNHYVKYGIKEGRFKNKTEEVTGAKVDITNQPVTNIAKETQVVDTPNNIEIIPVYNTYVDVDLTNQIVTYFENGDVKLQTPCVSGNTSLRRGTPTGTYHVMTHTKGKYLIGPTWRTWVDYWMQFTNNAVGLHDATWRSSFGGEIYKTNGSHGCVNLPHEAAKQLFDMITVGTTVVVH